jgi:hypothetical protein
MILKGTVRGGQGYCRNWLPDPFYAKLLGPIYAASINVFVSGEHVLEPIRQCIRKDLIQRQGYLLVRDCEANDVKAFIVQTEYPAFNHDGLPILGPTTMFEVVATEYISRIQRGAEVTLEFDDQTPARRIAVARMKIEEMQDYLVQWLNGLDEANKAAPAVRQTLDVVTWQVDTLALSPPEGAHLSTSEIDRVAGFELERLKVVLPQILHYHSSLLVSAAGTSTGSMYSYLSDMAELGSPETLAYASQRTEVYQQIQESQERPKRVRELLESRFPTKVAQFDSAKYAFDQCRAGIGKETAAALEMRTLVDGVKGELFERARKLPDEKMTWPIMSERLASGPAEKALMSEQERIRSTLYDELSGTAKDRRAKKQAAASIQDIWTRTMDHIHTVLSLTR